MDPRLKAKRDEIDRLKAEYNKLRLQVQVECKHEKVLEVPWDHLHNTTRICLCCGKEEEATNWGGFPGSLRDYAGNTTLNTEFVKQSSRQELHKARTTI